MPNKYTKRQNPSKSYLEKTNESDLDGDSMEQKMSFSFIDP